MRRLASDLANGVEQLSEHVVQAIFRSPLGSTRHATRKHSKVKRFRVPFTFIVGEGDVRAEEPLSEFVYLVLYHGDGSWSGPDHVTDLFQRSDPGRFRLVSWREWAGAGRPGDDTTALVLSLARSLSFEEMAAQVAALRLRVVERGDASLDAFMVERMGTMLRLRNYSEELKLGGAKTMTEVAERFHRSLDELVQRGARQSLQRLIARRFGEETAGQVSDVLEGLPGPEDIDRVTDAVIECGTGEEFIARVRTA